MAAPVTDLVKGIDTVVGKTRATLARHLVDRLSSGVGADLLSAYTVLLLAHGQRVTPVDVHDAVCVVFLQRGKGDLVEPWAQATPSAHQYAITVAEAIGAAVAELEAVQLNDLVVGDDQLRRLRTGAVLSNGHTVALRVNSVEPSWSVSGYEHDLTSAQVAAGVLPATVLALDEQSPPAPAPIPGDQP